MNTKIGGTYRWKGLIVALTAVALTACGGGGGDSGTPAANGAASSGGSGSTPPPATSTTPPPSTSTTPPPATGTTPPPATVTNPPPAATPLSISSSTPANLATGVALNTAPRVVFNVKVNPATITSLNPTAFTMRDVTNGNDVGGYAQLSDDGMTAIFTPRENLVANAEYAVTVTTAVKSVDGTSLAQNSTWNFTAGPVAVERTYPASAATAVAINSKIAAVFNTTIAPAAITSFTLREASAGGAPVVGTMAYNNDSTRAAVFTPTANLQPNTSYTATITTAATGQTSWTFTTGAQLDTVKPTVTFSPANNAENVGVNSAIKVTFSEAIDPSTIIGSTFFVSSVDAWLSGNIVFDSATNTAWFFPNGAMQPGSPYHIVVKSDIKDFAGNGVDTGANLELRSDFRTAP